MISENLIYAYYFIVILGFILFLISRRVPLLGLILLVFSVFFPFRLGLGMSLYNIVFFAVFLAWLAGALFIKNNRGKGNRLFFWFFPLIAAMLVSRLSVGLFLQLKEQFFIWVQIAIIYYITVNTIHKEHQLRRFLHIVAAFFAISSTLYIMRRLFLSVESITIFHRNFMATQIGLFLIIIFGFIFYEQVRSKKIMITCSGVIGLLALFSTASRWGVLICLSALLYLVFTFTTKNKNIMKNCLLVIFAVFSLFYLYTYFFNNGIYKTMFSLRTHTLAERVKILHMVWILFKQNPLLGIGSTAFRYYTFYSDTHNILLEIIVSSGLLGLSAFTAFIWMIRQIWLSKLSLITGRQKYLFICGACCLVFFAVREFSDYHFEGSMGIQLGLILGLTFALPLKANEIKA
jgi:O-antigen ligase